MGPTIPETQNVILNNRTSELKDLLNDALLLLKLVDLSNAGQPALQTGLQAETTSSLDSASEQYVQRTIDLLRMQKKTIIIIAHRLTTIRKADQIIVLDKGKVVEEGSHAEMIVANGHYANLWKQQFGDEDLTSLIMPSFL